MSLERTYGNEITLRAIANIFNVEVVVISTLGERGSVNILPQQIVLQISFEQPRMSLEQLPLENLEKIFLSALISLDFKFPMHVCWTFNNMLKTILYSKSLNV